MKPIKNIQTMSVSEAVVIFLFSPTQDKWPLIEVMGNTPI